MIVLAALIVAVAIAWAALQIVGELRATRAAAATEQHVAAMLTLFAPALIAIGRDPRAFLVWQPIASAARQLFPDAFAALDRASGGAFPFPKERLEAAHAQWTADWLAWELAHDTEYRLKAAAAEDEAARQGASPVTRARIDAVEREKLDLYQRHYADYIRTAKALQALIAR